MRDTYNETIRIGIISDIDSEKCTAEVIFPDRDDIVPRHLPILIPKTKYDKYYYIPDIGERVQVLFFPEAPTRGIIIGSYYDDTRLPPIDDENKTYVIFKDETHIEYDRELHTLKIKIPESGEKSINIETESDVVLKTNGNVKIEVAKDVEITVTGDTTINTTGETNIISAANVNVKGAEIHLNS